MRKLVDEYLVFLHHAKQVSENTYKSYSRDLKKLVSYLEEKGITDLARVDTANLEDYMNFLKKSDYAPATITRSFIAIKSLYAFLCNQGYTTENPAIMIKLPKAEGKPNPILSRGEMEALLKPPVAFSFKGLRDRAMLLLLYYTKISITDLVKLKVEAVDLADSKLIIDYGQGRREYCINEDTRDALSSYIQYKKFDAQDWLFPNRYGDAMSRQGFWKIVKNYAKDHGIDKEITLYSIKQGEV